MSLAFHMSLREMRTLARRLKGSMLTTEEAASIQRLRQRLELAIVGIEERQGTPS